MCVGLVVVFLGYFHLLHSHSCLKPFSNRYKLFMIQLDCFFFQHPLCTHTCRCGWLNFGHANCIHHSIHVHVHVYIVSIIASIKIVFPFCFSCSICCSNCGISDCDCYIRSYTFLQEEWPSHLNFPTLILLFLLINMCSLFSM